MCVVSLHSSVNPQLLASVFNMTKRDSVFAGIDPPRAPTSMQRRQSHLHGQSNSGATSSDGRSRPSTAMGTLPQNLHHGMDHSGSHSHAHHYGYTSVTPSVPLPEGPTTYPHEEEAYPLQAEIEQQHRVLHTHIFKEVISPHPTGINRLMVTEVDRLGVQRNRQPEFFFNGIVGHIRADHRGWINSWEQSTQLANYWRRYFNIPEMHNENTSGNTSWYHHQQPSGNADRHMKTKMHHLNRRWKTMTPSLPMLARHRFQVRFTSWLQSSSINILNNDRESNAAILEKLENPGDDLGANPVQVFTAADLAHLASHLAQTTQALAQQAQDMEDLSDIDD